MKNTNNILLTGYWPPTNEMLRQFSQTANNGNGWNGENWRNRGYNVHSYFPEFPNGTSVDPVGEGDFKVDYQSTSSDWQRITQELRPCAIITFSRGWSEEFHFSPPLRWLEKTWELEKRARNLKAWVKGSSPTLPDPSPPDPSFPPDAPRESTLPMSEIVKRITDSSLNIISYVDKIEFAGGFVSEFIAYHGMWYQATHTNDEAFRCYSAGHIHVGGGLTTQEAISATEITLEALVDHIEKYKNA